jgi:hypothetical protein
MNHYPEDRPLQLSQDTLSTAVLDGPALSIPLSIGDLSMIDNNSISLCAIPGEPANLLAKSQSRVRGEELDKYQPAIHPTRLPLTVKYANRVNLRWNHPSPRSPYPRHS